MQNSSARTKRHREDHNTEPVSKRTRMRWIDLTSEDELEPPLSLYDRCAGSYQHADSESPGEDMLGKILDLYQNLQADVHKLRKKNIELERGLVSAEDDSKERVIQMEKRHTDYMRAITNQALDVTTGVCNISGKLVSENCNLYIMEKCGALVCEEESRKSDLRCPVHFSEGIQKAHPVYNRTCAVCIENDPHRLIDTLCGHPMCRDCLKEWIDELPNNEDDDYFSCVVCKNEEVFEVFMRRPSLKHETSTKRSRSLWIR